MDKVEMKNVLFPHRYSINPVVGGPTFGVLK